MRVAVIGAAGRMGSEVCKVVEADADLQLVARIEHDDELGVLTKNRAEVAVEFTTPTSVKDNIRYCLEHGVHVVVGATGLSDDDLEDVRSWAEASEANAFVAPNFAMGAVLMMRFAAEAAAHFDSAEIVERHDEKKQDAPSGTSLRTAQLMNAARRKPWASPVEASESVEGSRGGQVDGIHVHSLRVPGSVAHQEVIFGNAGETLTIRHDSLDRGSFMPGVILAIKKVPTLGHLTVGLEQLFGR
jgi:4-hydroxy-tetrahydrodipicolinate reductase